MPRIRRDGYLIERKFPRINVVIWTRKTIEEFFKGLSEIAKSGYKVKSVILENVEGFTPSKSITKRGEV